MLDRTRFVLGRLSRRLVACSAAVAHVQPFHRVLVRPVHAWTYYRGMLCPGDSTVGICVEHPVASVVNAATSAAASRASIRILVLLIPGSVLSVLCGHCLVHEPLDVSG